MLKNDQTSMKGLMFEKDEKIVNGRASSKYVFQNSVFLTCFHKSWYLEAHWNVALSKISKKYVRQEIDGEFSVCMLKQQLV